MERFDVNEIKEALSEAREECYREPATNLWKSFWDRLTQGRFIPADPMDEQDKADTRTVHARDLKRGDVLVFGHDGYRLTVRYCDPSVVDPVYLIGFEENEHQIAKSPLDEVQVLISGFEIGREP